MTAPALHLVKSATLPPLASYLPAYESALVARGQRPRGVAKYIWAMRQYFGWLGPHATMPDLNAATLQAYQEHIAKRCGAGTIANALSAIRSFCKWAMRVGLRLDDPTTRLDWPRRRQVAPRAVKRDELRKLMIALADDPTLHPEARWFLGRNRRAVYLMLYAGLRISEAAALCWRDVDLEDRMLMVRNGKGGKDGAVPLHPLLIAELLTVPDRVPHHAVAGQQDGQPLSHKSMAHIFARWLRKRGITITAHQLRHSFATYMRRQGADVRLIQLCLRHASLETTQRYLGADTDELASAVHKLPSQW